MDGHSQLSLLSTIWATLTTLRSPLSALHHSLLRTALGRCFSSAFCAQAQTCIVLYSAAAKQMAVWMGVLPSLSASGLITRPVFGIWTACVQVRFRCMCQCGEAESRGSTPLGGSFRKSAAPSWEGYGRRTADDGRCAMLVRSS